MPHDGAGLFIQKLHGGAQQLGATAPPWDNAKIAFSSK